MNSETNSGFLGLPAVLSRTASPTLGEYCGQHHGDILFQKICFLTHLLAHKPLTWDWLGKLSDELKRLYRGTELIVQKAVAHTDFTVETSRYRHEAELACIVVKPIPRYCKIHKRLLLGTRPNCVLECPKLFFFFNSSKEKRLPREPRDVCELRLLHIEEAKPKPEVLQFIPLLKTNTEAKFKLSKLFMPTPKWEPFMRIFQTLLGNTPCHLHCSDSTAVTCFLTQTHCLSLETFETHLFRGRIWLRRKGMRNKKCFSLK